MELDKEYKINVKYDDKNIWIGTIEKFIYDNEIFYIVKQEGKHDKIYTNDDIIEFLKNKFIEEDL